MVADTSIHPQRADLGDAIAAVRCDVPMLCRELLLRMKSVTADEHAQSQTADVLKWVEHIGYELNPAMDPRRHPLEQCLMAALDMLAAHERHQLPLYQPAGGGKESKVPILIAKIEGLGTIRIEPLGDHGAVEVHLPFRACNGRCGEWFRTVSSAKRWASEQSSWYCERMMRKRRKRLVWTEIPDDAGVA